MPSLTTYVVLSSPDADADLKGYDRAVDEPDSPTGPRTYRTPMAYHVITIAGWVVTAGALALVLVVLLWIGV